MSLDDIEIKEAPTCPQPIALNVSNVTLNSAAFGWTEVGSATNWQVEWGISGFTLGGGVRLMTTTNPHTQLGLQPATTYDFYVRSVCTIADSSLWSGPFTFTTPCMIVTSYPYFEDFENGKGCWSENNTTNGSWGFGTPAGVPNPQEPLVVLFSLQQPFPFSKSSKYGYEVTIIQGVVKVNGPDHKLESAIVHTLLT